MSQMSSLDAELKAAGIDPDGVDWEKVQKHRERMWLRTGHTPTMIEAVRELYKPVHTQ